MNKVQQLISASVTKEALFSQLYKNLTESAWALLKARQDAYAQVHGDFSTCGRNTVRDRLYYNEYRYLVATGNIEISVGETIHASLIERGCMGNSDEIVGGLTLNAEDLDGEGVITPAALEREQREFRERLLREQEQEKQEQKRQKAATREQLRQQLKELEDGTDE